MIPSDEPERSYSIDVVDEQQDVSVDCDRVVALAARVLAAEGVPAGAYLGVRFVQEGEMRDLNREFMGRDGPTDVLSFPVDGPGLSRRCTGGEGGDRTEAARVGRLDEERSSGDGTGGEEPPAVVGDIVICPRVARANAERAARSLQAELDHLVVHGVLHLLGWTHDESSDADQMRAREAELLEVAV